MSFSLPKPLGKQISVLPKPETHHGFQQCPPSFPPSKWWGPAILLREPKWGRGSTWMAWQRPNAGKEGTQLRGTLPGPVLTTSLYLPYPQKQSSLTHRQSWGAHGTWVARLSWRTLQRKADMMMDQPSTFLRSSRCPPTVATLGHFPSPGSLG